MKKILLVEDEENLVDIVATVLEGEGFEVRKSPSAEDALKVVPEFLPDLIVSDLKMGELDGLGFMEQIRSEDRLKTIPFIFLTSLDDPVSQAKAKSLGAMAYMTKPFDIDNLVQVIKQTLGA
jgi:CheY-like chemotaxis protein